MAITPPIPKFGFLLGFRSLYFAKKVMLTFPEALKRGKNSPNIAGDYPPPSELEDASLASPPPVVLQPLDLADLSLKILLNMNFLTRIEKIWGISHTNISTGERIPQTSNAHGEKGCRASQ